MTLTYWDKEKRMTLKQMIQQVAINEQENELTHYVFTTPLSMPTFGKPMLGYVPLNEVATSKFFSNVNDFDRDNQLAMAHFPDTTITQAYNLTNSIKPGDTSLPDAEVAALKWFWKFFTSINLVRQPPMDNVMYWACQFLSSGTSFLPLERDVEIVFSGFKGSHICMFSNLRQMNLSPILCPYYDLITNFKTTTEIRAYVDAHEELKSLLTYLCLCTIVGLCDTFTETRNMDTGEYVWKVRDVVSRNHTPAQNVEKFCYTIQNAKYMIQLVHVLLFPLTDNKYADLPNYVAVITQGAINQSRSHNVINTTDESNSNTTSDTAASTSGIVSGDTGTVASLYPDEFKYVQS
ncbi:clamp protein [Fako virus]|uniref:Clamp protein n=1 Tax=Fako virus TaxID=1567404 RepID=A0A0A0UEE5_9REOV|nr:clamp protein [Fako virus]6DJY_A Chain A, Clamp protein [Fako virus]AIW39888.1 clamp protein [Fako virus]AIW39889.1 clamp protein [Fako virus]AIW39890.1 clamp protein [Fako virus]AIW39891.1 clamp protein [Fako virus]